MKNIKLKNPFDLHAMWRKQMLINTVIFAVVAYFFKFSTFNQGALTCVVAGCATYILFWFNKRNLENEHLVSEYGIDFLKRSAIKTLLSSLSWFILSAILYLMSIFNVIVLLKPYLG